MKNLIKTRILMALMSLALFAVPLNVCTNVHAAADGTRGFNLRKLALALGALVAQPTRVHASDAKVGTIKPGVSSPTKLGACHADNALDVLAPSQACSKPISPFDICTPEACMRFEEGISVEVCEPYDQSNCINMNPWGDARASDCSVDAVSRDVHCVDPEKNSYEENPFAVKATSEWSGPQWAAESLAEYRAAHERRLERGRIKRTIVQPWLRDKQHAEAQKERAEMQSEALAQAGAGADAAHVRTLFLKLRNERYEALSKLAEERALHREQAKIKAEQAGEGFGLAKMLDDAAIMYAMTTASQEELRTIKLVFNPSDPTRQHYGGMIDHKSYLIPPAALLQDQNRSKEVEIFLGGPDLFSSYERYLVTLAHEIGHIVEARLAHRVHCFTTNPQCRLNAEVLADMCSVFLAEAAADIGLVPHTKSFMLDLLAMSTQFNRELNLYPVDSIAQVRDESGNLRDTYFKGMPTPHPENGQRITMTANTYNRYKAILRHFKQQRTSKKR